MSRISETGSQNGGMTLVGPTPCDYAEAHPPPTMSPMVAETKLSRPGLSSRLLSEMSRLQLLDGAEDVPFTLISAPAGFGKTTLVSQWLEERKPVHAWLSLDQRDNTPALFWNSVASALARVDTRFAIRESTLLAALEPNAVVDPVALLVNRLADYARTWQAPLRLYLVLDDFHLIDQPDLLEQVRRFIDFAPGLLRILCLSRTDPPIRTAQLLARDRMFKLGPADLCFDLELTRKFIRGRQPEISDADITHLHERTGGWPAALQLSALSGRLSGPGQDSDDLRGRTALAEYLLEEVFIGLEPDLQQFLMDMSLLPLFSADIANQARSAEDATALIAMMRERNLLFQRYGSGQTWYRLHDLLAEWLRARQSDPDRAREIQMAGARAFEQAGLIAEALELFLVTDCYSEAEALVPALLQSDELAGHRALPKRFPETVRNVSPAIVLLEALFDFMDGRYDSVLSKVEQAGALLDQRPGSDPDTLRFIALLLTWPAARFTGREAAAQTSIVQVSEQLTPGRGSLHNWGLYTLGADAFMDARMDSARMMLGKALAGALELEDGLCAIRCLAILVPVMVQGGCADDAQRVFQRACERLVGGPPAKEQAGLLAYLEGLLALERHELERARMCLEEASQLAPERMTLLDRLYLAFELFRLGMITGNEEQWRSQLQEIRELHQQMALEDWSHNIPQPAALESLAQLSAGNAFPLMVWAGSDGSARTTSRFSSLHERLLRLVGELLTGADVTEALQQLEADAMAGGVQLVVCHVNLVRVLLCAFRDQDLPGAARLLAEQLSVSVPRGLLRPFLDAELRLDDVLEECRRQGWSRQEACRVLELRHDQELSLRSGSSADRPCSETDMPEPLSQREHDVLALLSAGLSNKAMSEQLGITVATVKSHLSNIYGKLQADNRVRAISRAREMGLMN